MSGRSVLLNFNDAMGDFLAREIIPVAIKVCNKKGEDVTPEDVMKALAIEPSKMMGVKSKFSNLGMSRPQLSGKKKEAEAEDDEEKEASGKAEKKGSGKCQNVLFRAETVRVCGKAGASKNKHGLALCKDCVKRVTVHSKDHAKKCEDWIAENVGKEDDEEGEGKKKKKVEKDKVILVRALLNEDEKVGIHDTFFFVANEEMKVIGIVKEDSRDEIKSAMKEHRKARENLGLQLSKQDMKKAKKALDKLDPIQLKSDDIRPPNKSEKNVIVQSGFKTTFVEEVPSEGEESEVEDDEEEIKEKKKAKVTKKGAAKKAKKSKKEDDGDASEEEADEDNEDEASEKEEESSKPKKKSKKSKKSKKESDDE